MPSTVIQSFTYNADTQQLRIVFVGGRVYDYLDVPQDLYTEMRASFAKGIYFNEKIKPFFKCVRVTAS